MTHSPKLFGYEGIAYWNTSLFPVNPPTKYEPTGLEITTWFSGATISDDVQSFNFISSNQSIDLSPRPHAARGWLTSFMLPGRLQLTFLLQHQSGTGLLIHNLITAWQSRAETAMAFMDGAATGARGVIGNFFVTMSKREPIRNFQDWTVTLDPSSYIDYYEQ